VRPRLLALALLALGPRQAPAGRPLRDRPLRRARRPKVRVVEIGGTIGGTITLGDAVQSVRAVVKDLKGTVVARS
jgi:hypothetical protein